MDFDKINEGYTEGEEKYHFYYNREERLKNAPKIVQDYYDGKMQPLRGFKALFANKANRFVLISLVFFIAVSWSYFGLRSFENEAKINGVNFELDAFAYEDEIYSNVKIAPSNKKKSFDVKVVFSAIDQNSQVVFTEELEENYEGKELYLRTKFTDYDITEMKALISVGKNEKELSTDIKR